MSLPHNQPTTVADAGQHTDSAERESSRAVDRIGADHPGLAMERPEVIALAGAFVEALHAGLVGRATALCAPRKPDYRRAQMIGRERWSEVDLSVLCFDAPTAIRPALEILLSVCGEPVRRVGPGVASATAEAVTSAAAAVKCAVGAESDGHVDGREYHEVRAALNGLVARVADALATLDARAPWRQTVAVRVAAHREARRG